MDVNNLARLLEDNASLFEALIDLLPAPVYIKDSRGQFLQFNSAFAQLWNLPEDHHQLLGNNLAKVYGDHPTIEDLHQREQALMQDRGCRIDQLDCSDVLGKPAIFHIHSCATQDEQGNLTGFVAILFDITARVELERKLEQLSQVDELTNIGNRRHGMAHLDSALDHARRHHFNLSLTMLDIDLFKQVNDQYGHKAGDLALQEIAHVLQRLTRSSDTLFRYGGEEFVVILPNTGQSGALTLAERFRETIVEHPFQMPNGDTQQLTVSIGVASFPDDAADSSSLFLAADAALYQAKSHGRNRTVHYRTITENPGKK